MEESMIQNKTFEQDIASRKAAQFFLWLQLGAMILVLGLIALRLHTVAWGIVWLMLFLSGTLLLWLYRRYQASPLVKEKHDLRARAIHLQGQVAEEGQRLNETRKRREHLLRKEQFGLEATLFNLQKHHIVKGLSTHLIKDAAITGVGPKLKERLAELGIHTALDVSEHAVNQVPGVGAAKRVALMSWRSTLYAQLDATKPVKLPDHQLEYIQKKFQRLHAANDEKEKIAADYHQQLKATLNATEMQLEQVASMTFRAYLANALSSKKVQHR
jgi:DNA-binding helix-hairpin-helix protein with protein kinase domain